MVANAKKNLEKNAGKVKKQPKSQTLKIKSGKRTRRQFRPEHLDGHDVDDEDPDGRGEDVGLVVGLVPERDDAHALRLHLAAVGVGTLQLAVHVLLELLHVEDLQREGEF